MTSIDIGFTRLRTAAGRLVDGYGRVDRFFKRLFKGVLPKGLYARALFIIIAPMVILQIIVTFVFMERHWNTVTRRLSAAVVQDIAAVIDLRKGFPQDRDYAELRRIAQERLGLVVDFLPVTELPPIGPKPFFSLLDQALSEELRKKIGRPFWIDTVGRSSLVEIRIPAPGRGDAHLCTPRRRLCVEFGNLPVVDGRHVAGADHGRDPVSAQTRFARFCGSPKRSRASAKAAMCRTCGARGAQEVRRAAVAFLEMKARVERTLEQRTAMLAGVSHDLRTVLTRFKLELAMLDESPETEAMKKDVDEMSRMLEGYLAFARGDAGERSEPTDMAAFLDELKTDVERHGRWAAVQFHGYPVATESTRSHASVSSR